MSRAGAAAPPSASGGPVDRAAEPAGPASPEARDVGSADSPASSAGAVTGADSADPAVAGLWRALKDVLDPEFPISVVDLGLVYGIRREGGRVHVELTFTATACPCMDFIREDVRDRLLREDGVEEVEIHVVWDPPWTRERMTEEGRAVLRRFGVAA